MPGLIEGAHLGHGLGVQFLKHIERTSVLVHLIDVSDNAIMAEHSSAEGSVPTADPVDNYNVITAELKAFDPSLAAKPTLLVATKADVANPGKLKKLQAFAKRKKLPLHTISAVTGEGLDKLKFAIADAVATHRAIDLAAPPGNEPAIERPARRKPHYPPPAPSARVSRR
jgi:GTP-binding protein